MRSLFIRAAFASVLFAVANLAAQTNDTASLGLVLDLKDGSRVVGQFTPRDMPVRIKSESLGEIKIPFERVRSVKFRDDTGAADVVLQNGDALQGVLLHESIELATSFGRVEIPLAVVKELQVQRTGGGEGSQLAVDWRPVPFARDSDWGADRGQPAKITDDGIVFRGQPAASDQTFSAPLTIECEAIPESLRGNDGCVWIAFVPEDSPRDMGPRGALTCAFGYQQPGGSGGHLSIDKSDGQTERLTSRSFTVHEGQTYRLRIELMRDAIRVTLNDKTYEANDVAAPAGKFYIRIQGWQPLNRWRVRNIVVR